MRRSFFAAAVGFIAIVLGGAPSSAQMAYITNENDNTVSVIDTATNTVVGTIPVSSHPYGVAVSSDGSKVYVASANLSNSAVTVIATATNTVTATIPVAYLMGGIAVTPDGSKVYVTNITEQNTFVTVIDTATNAVTNTIPLVNLLPGGIAVSPDGSKVYVAISNTVMMIDTASDTVVDTIVINSPYAGRDLAITLDGSTIYVAIGLDVRVIDTASRSTLGGVSFVGFVPLVQPNRLAVTPDGSKIYVSMLGNPHGAMSVVDTSTLTVIGSPITFPGDAAGIAITPDGSKVYVANVDSDTVSVIDTATNIVTAVLPVGTRPIASGIFIQPRFAATPGDANCYGKSLSALAQTFGGLNAAAIVLGFPTVPGLQTAVSAFCGA